MSHHKVYSYGPVFRAEKHNTTHHLAEFWMLELEMSFVDRLDDVMLVVEKFLKDLIYFFLNSSLPQEILKNVHNRDSSYMDHLDDLLFVYKEPFGRISYDNACKILENDSPSFKISNPEEKFVVEKVFNRRPTFFFNYPIQQKPFYMKLNDDNKTVSGFDLVIPGVGELAGGSIREYRKKNLEMQIERLNLSIESYKWYVDMCKFGIPRGGFGIGMERLLQYLSKTSNIRENVISPRFKHT